MYRLAFSTLAKIVCNQDGLDAVRRGGIPLWNSPIKAGASLCPEQLLSLNNPYPKTQIQTQNQTHCSVLGFRELALVSVSNRYRNA